MLWTGQVISKDLRAVTKNVEREGQKNAVKRTENVPYLKTKADGARTHPSPALCPLEETIH